MVRHVAPLRLLRRRNVLSISSGIEDIGIVKWDLALCLLAVWVICFFCIWKGVKSTGKVSGRKRRLVPSLAVLPGSRCLRSLLRLRGGKPHARGAVDLQPRGAANQPPLPSKEVIKLMNDQAILPTSRETKEKS